MDKPTDKQNPFDISEEAQNKAKEVMESAVRDFSAHLRQITEDLAEFNKSRQEMRGRMKNGARRTSGRIV